MRICFLEKTSFSLPLVGGGGAVEIGFRGDEEILENIAPFDEKDIVNYFDFRVVDRRG